MGPQQQHPRNVVLMHNAFKMTRDPATMYAMPEEAAFSVRSPDSLHNSTASASSSPAQNQHYNCHYFTVDHTPLSLSVLEFRVVKVQIHIACNNVDMAM